MADVQEQYDNRNTEQNEAAEAAFLTTHNIAVVLETAAKTLEEEYREASDTAAQAVTWQLRAAAKELEGASDALQQAFWF